MQQPEGEAAELTLARLKEQVNDVRAELAALRRELAGIRIELGRASDVHLVKDNRRLILVARKAEMRAASAVASLIELSRASERDALTGTPNRTLMLERVERGIAVARRRQMRVAILFADLDGFKQINDAFGHAVGDEALRVTSRRFESVVRDSDTVSRHGGDEFLVLLTALAEPSDAAAISAKLLASLARPARVGAHVLRLSASIGIAVYPEDGEDAATLIGVADAAMFRSKRRGPGRFGFHEPRVAVTDF
jgi:diguanylate cyclase (GGDEF)-like protein